MAKCIVFNNAGKRWLHKGVADQCGLVIAFDDEVASNVARREWSDPSLADKESGLFSRICDYSRIGGSRGVCLYYIHARRLIPVFYSWEYLAALGLGLEPCGVNELIAGEGTAGEQVFTVQDDGHRAALLQLAEMVAPSAAAAS